MTKLKSLFRRLWDFMNDPRLEKPLMIAAPILTLILAGLIFLPRFMDTLHHTPAPAAEVQVQQTQPQVVTTLAPAVEPSLQPTPKPPTEPTPEPTPEATPTPLIPLRMTWNSVNRDLLIRILGEDGTPVTGYTFRLDVRFPNGETYCYDTEDDGSNYYLVRLEPGEYVVSMQAYEGFAQPEPIHCTVKAEAQYTPIENIETEVEVKDVSEVSQAEVPDDTNNAPAETVPEVIVLSDQEEDETPVLDENGDQRYHYQFPVGPNGYLLYQGTDTESNVIPVDEDGDGIPEYGMYLVEPDLPEVVFTPLDPEDSIEPDDSEDLFFMDDPVDSEDPDDQESAEEPTGTQEEAYYVSLELYKPDGTPVDTYEYTQIPLVEVEEKLVGWQTIDGNEYFFQEDGSKAVGLKRISGKLYYFSQYGVKASSIGIDVSFYDADIDWQAVKAQGIDFAIIRVGGRGWSSGVLYDDIRTQEYLRGARAAGIKIGVYFYSTAINPYEAVEEASVALKAIGGISLDYPIFIDLEYSGDYPEGRSDNLNASERAEIAIAFCETIRNSGYRAGVYAGQNFLKSAINYGAISGYTIWLASYTVENQLPNFSNRYDIWQFTDRALVDGISSGVDMNVIF